MDESIDGSPDPQQSAPDPRPSRLRRSRDERVVAGVSGGLGTYFDIDPVVFRIGFVITTIFGGFGILAYLIGWVAIPDGIDEGSHLDRVIASSRASSRQRMLVAVALVVLALAIAPSISPWGGADSNLLIPLLILAAGVALLVWPESDAAALDTPSSPSQPSPSSPLQAPDSLASTTATSQTVLEAPPLPDGPHRVDRQPNRSPITPLTIAALMILTGGAVLLDRIGAVDVVPVEFVALAVTVIGVGVMVSAFIGRARGLIVLGVVLLPVLWTLHVVDIEWHSGIGDEIVIIDSLDEVDAQYNHGIGRLELDLRRLDLDDEQIEVSVGLTIGELLVLVPDDITVRVEAEGRIGELTVDDGSQRLRDEGIDLEIATTVDAVDGDGDGLLVLDIDLGIGEGRVEVVEAN